MQANIVDINDLDIKNIDKTEKFALDTNILYWTHYSNASNPNLKVLPYQVTQYPNFIEELLENGNTLVTTVLNITELIHIVENSERKIYNAVNNLKIKKKEYRAICTERKKYQNEVKTILSQLKETYGEQIRVIDISEEKINEFVSQMHEGHCDVFDYIILNKLKEEGITNLISDDKDFTEESGIVLYTTYASVLQTN